MFAPIQRQDEEDGAGDAELESGVDDGLLATAEHPAIQAIRGSGRDIASNRSLGAHDGEGGIRRSKLNINEGGSGKTLTGGVDPATIKRSEWGGKLEFMLTCISYAVGLGNVWRFPYLCFKNGGGAFLLPYLVMLFTIGIPLFFLELSWGQFASLGPTAVWSMNLLFKGVGFGMVTVSAVISIYYNVIIAQCLLYFGLSFRSELGWASCDNEWNSPYCITSQMNKTVRDTLKAAANASDYSHYNSESATYSNIYIGTASEEFYYNYVLEMSQGGIGDPGRVVWKLAVCLLVCWILVFAGLVKGVQSLGKLSYFTAIFPYVMLTILFILGLTLDGSTKGMLFFLTPSFERLGDSQVWVDAGVQIFFSLSCASGGLIAMGSFNKFNNNTLRDSMIVPLLNSATSMYAGLVVFGILGFMADLKGVEIEDVATQGPGLVFITYPEALCQLPCPPLWSVLFFIMMLALGFGSELSIAETFFSAIQDELFFVLDSRKKKLVYRAIAATVFFLAGLPMCTQGGQAVLGLVDFHISTFPLLLLAFLELVALIYVYSYEHLKQDIKMMLNREPPKFFEYMWRFGTLGIVVILFFMSTINYAPPTMNMGTAAPIPYPPWAVGLGWGITMIPVSLIFGWALYYYCTRGGWVVCVESMMPIQTWGPRLVENRHGRYQPPLETADGKSTVPEIIISTDYGSACSSKRDQQIDP